MHRNKEDKTHKDRSAMLICRVCLVRGGRSWIVPNPKAVYHKLFQVISNNINDYFAPSNLFSPILDSVRQAVTATSLASVAPLETVAQAAGSSPEIQTAYRNLLRTTVQSNLRNNEDYLPERFPNISNYFNGNHQPQW